MQILRANPDDAVALTAIAFAAKRHWRYPEAWIDDWRDILTVTPEFIAANETHAAVVEGQPVGFYAVVPKNGRFDLQHLWVLPDSMRRGIGRCLFRHAVERAQALGFHELEIESDPNAEPFYHRMGARRTGSVTRTVDHQTRELPILIYTVNRPN